MGPEISTRIQAMLRSVNEVILPAIDPKADAALEQAYLIMGYLRVIAHQYDKLVHFRLHEIREYTALLQRLLGLAGSYAESPAAAEAGLLVADVQALAELGLPPDPVLRDAIARLRILSDRLVSDLLEKGVPHLTLEVGHTVTEFACKEILRERAWVAPAGMDQAPSEVPSIDELLRLA